MARWHSMQRVMPPSRRPWPLTLPAAFDCCRRRPALPLCPVASCEPWSFAAGSWIRRKCTRRRCLEESGNARSASTTILPVSAWRSWFAQAAVPRSPAAQRDQRMTRTRTIQVSPWWWQTPSRSLSSTVTGTSSWMCTQTGAVHAWRRNHISTSWPIYCAPAMTLVSAAMMQMPTTNPRSTSRNPISLSSSSSYVATSRIPLASRGSEI
mmetsp:Transcript_106366/g.253930  ORF Transcript_106366/g.253930 Transcript_106366/m.253930 type:complete len:209 (-) Transcript_106366:1038-1664(-)